MYSLCGKAHEVTSCLLQLRPLTQAKGLVVDKNFFSRVKVKEWHGLDIRVRDSGKRGYKRSHQLVNALEAVADKGVRDNGLRSHLRYC
jgi:hypothetical protein